MKRYDYILFDLDGTIIDSSPGITRAAQHALAKYGIHEEPENLTKFIGPPLTQAFAEFYGFDGERAAEAVYAYREYYRVQGIHEAALYDGIAALLCKLKKSGRKVILASAKPQIFAEQVLRDFDIGQYFDGIYGGEMYISNFTKADIITAAMEGCGVDASRAVMVGDRLHDIEGAHACGLPAIGVLYGFGGREELESHGADFIADDMAALERLLF